MKKVCLIIIISLLLLVEISIKSNKEKESQIAEPNKILAIYIENDNGDYVQYNQNSWPMDKYVLNEELSRCDNGDYISYNYRDKKLITKSKGTDACYIYFDKMDNKIVEIYLGDVNADGKVQSGDTTQIKRYLTANRTFTEAQKQAADVSRDGKVSDADVDLILAALAGEYTINPNTIKLSISLEGATDYVKLKGESELSRLGLYYIKDNQ